MSDTPEYILRPEVETYIYDDEQGASFSIKGKDQAFAWLDGNFHRVFVPFDRQALTEQLEEIIYKHGETIDAQGASDGDLDARVAEVLALFGLENKEGSK